MYKACRPRAEELQGSAQEKANQAVEHPEKEEEETQEGNESNSRTASPSKHRKQLSVANPLSPLLLRQHLLQRGCLLLPRQALSISQEMMKNQSYSSAVAVKAIALPLSGRWSKGSSTRYWSGSLPLMILVCVDQARPGYRVFKSHLGYPCVGQLCL
ncbi:uncharacterized protein TrAtP1_001749 [Trichoderma atroviride]|uniref:uncharacterized protein n=1 Tax=Hypocrea atroviridis TaxID=63577 RepID=UPI00331BF082|nr:hypothetical protein TrAtP1_001749 [Trichoderma atroviride]